MNFESKLNDLLLLSRDWRTTEIFKTEAARLVADLSARVATTEERVTLARDLGGLQAVIEIQDQWLRRQLLMINEPGFQAPVVSWVM